MTRTTPGAAVVTLGECLGAFVALDRGPISETADFRLTVAGAEANVAVGLARLGVPVTFVGRVGDDGLGTAIRRRLRGEGVDVSHVEVDTAAPTGVLIRELRDLGPSEVVYWRSGSAGSRLSVEDVAAASDRLRAMTWLHVTGITPALSSSAAAAVEAALSTAVDVDATVSIDINLRRRLWSETEAAPVLRSLVARCHVVLGSPDELAVVSGLDADSEPRRLAEAVLDLGPHRVIVKLGDQGAYLRQRGTAGQKELDLRVAPYPVARVVDPVGAGDAFTAGYIAATIGGATEADALTSAAACGAAVVSTLGDQPGLPTAAELRRLLEGRGPDTLR